MPFFTPTHSHVCCTPAHTHVCSVCAWVGGFVGSWCAACISQRDVVMCVCTCDTRHTHTHTPTPTTRTHTHKYANTHAYTPTHAHTQKQTQTHTDTHIHTNIYTHDTHQEHLCNTDKCQANNRCWFLIIQSIPRCLPRTACKFSSFRPFVLFLAPPFFLCLSSMPACTPAIQGENQKCEN